MLCRKGSAKWPKCLQPLQPWVVLGAGFLVHFTLGAFYSYGNYAPYIVSYIRNMSHPSDLDYGQSVWIHASSLFAQGISMFLGGCVELRFGPRVSTLIGTVLIVFGVLLSYFTVQVSFWLLLVTYGLVFGLGIGMAYIGPLASGMRWLPKWKGTANGFVISGFGLGALAFDAIQTAYINPRNASPSYTPHPDNDDEKYFVDEKLLSRVPFSFLIMGAVYFAILFPSSLFLSNPSEEEEGDDTGRDIASEDVGESIDRGSIASTNVDRERSASLSPHRRGSGVELQYTSQAPSAASARNSQSDLETDSESDLGGSQGLLPTYKPKNLAMKQFRMAAADKEQPTPSSPLRKRSWTRNIITSLTPWQVLCKYNFYFLWVMLLLNGTAIAVFVTLFKFFGIAFIENDHFLTAIGSVAAIFNAVGRIFWGFIADKFSYKLALVSLNGLLTAFLLTFYASRNLEAMYFVWVCIIFFFIGGNYTLFPTAIARSFGPKYMGVNYGLLFTSLAVAGPIGALISEHLVFLLKWYGLFFVTSAFACLAFLLSILYRPKRFFGLAR